MARKQDSLSATSALVRDRLAVRSTEKRQELEARALEKESFLDPDYYGFDSKSAIVIDGDTFYDTRLKKLIRIGADRGYMLDTFESGVDRHGAPTNYYENNPIRFRAHAKAYARQAGLDEDEVTPDHLYRAAAAQKQAFQERINSGQLEGKGFRLTGKDSFGTRDVAVFDDAEDFDYISGMNAAYFSKFNTQQRIDNQATGLDQKMAIGDQRSWDQIVSEGVKNTLVEGLKIPVHLWGAGNMITGAALAALGAEDLSEDFFHMTDLALRSSKGLDKWKESWKSEGKEWQELMASNFQTYVQDPLYRKRAEDFQKKGYSPLVAKSAAWIAGVKDSVSRMLDNPASIADVSLESMIYFVGSGMFSRMATKGLAAQIKAAATSGAGEAAIASLQKELSKKAVWAAVGFTGVTEGVSNGMGAFGRVMELSEEELLADSERYQALLDQGMSPEAARLEVAGQAGALTTVATGILAGAANKLTGAAKVEAGLFRNIDDLLKNGAKTGREYLKKLPGAIKKPLKATKSIGKGAVKVADPALREGVEEIIQSGGGEIVSQEISRAVTDVESLRDPGASIEAASAGLLAGVATGGTLGNVSTAGKAIGRVNKKAGEVLGKRADKKHQAIEDAQRRIVTTNSDGGDAGSPGAQAVESAKSGLRGDHHKVQRELDQSKTPGQTSQTRLIEKADAYDAAQETKSKLNLNYEDDVTYYDEYKKYRALNPATTAEEKAADERIHKYMKAAEEAYKFDLVDKAKAVVEGFKDENGKQVEPLPAEVVLTEPLLYDIVARAITHTDYKLPAEWGKGTEERAALDRRLHAEQEIYQAVESAEKLAEAVIQETEDQQRKAGKSEATIARQRKRAEQVKEEKMGYGRPGKLGLRGYVREMTGILHSATISPGKKRKQFKALASRLDQFINSQAQRYAKMQELNRIFNETGRVTQADEAKINKLPGGRVFWIPPNASNQGGSPALLQDMENELGEMRHTQRKLGELALEFDQTNEAAAAAVEAGKQPVQESAPSDTTEQAEKSNKETATQRVARKLVDGYSARLKNPLKGKRREDLIAFAEKVLETKNLDEIVPENRGQKAILQAERLRRAKKGGKRDIPTPKASEADNTQQKTTKVGLHTVKYSEAVDTVLTLIAKGPGLRISAWLGDGIDRADMASENKGRFHSLFTNSDKGLTPGQLADIFNAWLNEQGLDFPILEGTQWDEQSAHDLVKDLLGDDSAARFASQLEKEAFENAEAAAQAAEEQSEPESQESEPEAKTTPAREAETATIPPITVEPGTVLSQAQSFAIQLYNRLRNAPVAQILKKAEEKFQLALEYANTGQGNRNAGLDLEMLHSLMRKRNIPIPEAHRKMISMTEEQLEEAELRSQIESLETSIRIHEQDVKEGRHPHLGTQAEYLRAKKDLAELKQKLINPRQEQSATTLNVWAGSNENTEFSNLAPRPFTYEGRRYFSVEHAYQTLKSGTFDEVTYDRYTEGRTERIVGKRRANQALSITLMEALIRASFEQNPEAAAALVATGTAHFTHTQAAGSIWVDHFPRILMQVRSELQTKATKEPTAREQAREAAQARIDAAPEGQKQAEYEKQTDNTLQGKAEAQEATQEGSEPVISEEEQAAHEATLDAWAELHEQEQQLEKTQTEETQVERTIFNEEDGVEAQQIAWYELTALEEAIEEMPDLRKDQVMFSHEKMYNLWGALVEANPDLSTKELLTQVREIANATFSEEGKQTPEATLTEEKSADVLKSAETLSDPTAEVEAETKSTSTGEPGIFARTINYRFRKLLGHEAKRSAIVGLWKLANNARRANRLKVAEETLAELQAELKATRAPAGSTKEVKAEFAAAREDLKAEIAKQRAIISYSNQLAVGPGQSRPSIVTKWLRDYNIAKRDGNLEKSEQTLTPTQREEMQKPWRFFVADVEHSLRLNSLPRAISAFLKPARAKTRNLLNRMAPVFTVLGDYGSRVKFFAATKMVGRERMGMTRIVDFVNRFEGHLRELALRPIVEDNKNSPYYKETAGKDLRGIFQPLREYALHLLFESGTDTLHSNVAAAIALVAGEWATSTGTQSIFQNDKTINERLGRDENEFVTPEMREIFQHGTLVSNVAQDLGWRILRQLNLADAHAEGIDPLHIERMATSLGLLALKALEADGQVELYTIPRAAMWEYSKKKEHQTGEGDFNAVRLAIDPDTGKESARSRNLRSMYMMAGSALKRYFNLETGARGPHFEVPDIVTRIEGTYGRLPERMKKALEHASSRVWRPIDDAFEEIENFSRKEMLEMLGWVDPKLISELHQDKRRSQESKNATIERDLDHALEWRATAGSLPFHFAYKLIRSGRIYIDSNTVNPQSSKLHRFLFAQESWALDMPIGGDIKDPLRRKKILMLKVAIAQAMGKPVDKQKLQTSAAQFAEMAAEDWFKNAITALRKAPADRNEQDKAAIAEAVRQGGEGMHSLLALKSWAKYQQALADHKAKRIPSQILKITLPLEIDGVTNGFAIGLLQTPHGEALYDMLEAVGVYTEDSIHKSVHEYTEEGNKKDNYLQLLDATHVEFSDMSLNGAFNQAVREEYWETFGLREEVDGELKFVQGGYLYQPLGRERPLSEPFYIALSTAELQQFLAILTSSQRESLKWNALPDSKGKSKQQQEEEARQSAILKVQHVLKLRKESAAHFRQIMAISPIQLDRDTAKGPLMTSAYGAGMAAIRRAIARKALNAFIDELSDLRTYETVVKEDGTREFVNSETARKAYASFRARADLLVETGREDNPLRLFTEQELRDWLKEKRDSYLKLWEEAGQTDHQINEMRKNFDLDRTDFADNPKNPDEIYRTVTDPVNEEETKRVKMSYRTLLSEEIESTLGLAVTRGLKQKIEGFEKTREYFNQGMQLANLIFEANFRRLIKLEQKATKGRAVSNERRKELLNEMIKEGLVPAVKTPLSQDQLDSLEITKYGKVVLKNDLEIEERGRAYFRKPQSQTELRTLIFKDRLRHRVEEEKKRTGSNRLSPQRLKELYEEQQKELPLREEQMTDSMTSILQVLDVDADVGVSMLVNLIHSSDGATMADVLTAYDVLGVHDAVVGNPLDLIEAGKAANESFWENQKNWNLGQEIFDTLQRMMPLLNPGDQRLNAEEKARIMRGFARQLEKGKYAPDDVKDWFAQFTDVVNQNNEARAELLSRIRRIHQFAFPGTEVDVEGVDIAPQKLEVPTSIRNFIDAAVAAQENWWNEWATVNSRLVRENILHEDGNPQKVIVELITQHQPSAAAVLDLMMQSLFHLDTVKEIGLDKEAVEHLRAVAAVIMPGLVETSGRQINIVIGSTGENTYSADTTTIVVDGSPENFLPRLMHEMIHAANYHRLEAIKENDPDKFEQMKAETRKWVKIHKGASKSSRSGMLRAMLEILLDSETLAEEDLDSRLEALVEHKDSTYYQTLTRHYLTSKTLGDGDVRAVAEFTAWLNTTVNDTGTLTWPANEGAFEALSKSMETKSGRKIYYSGPRGVDHTAFQDQEGVGLNSLTLLQTWGTLRTLDNLSPQQQEFYDNILNSFILPALEGLDTIILKMIDDPNGETPEGAVISDHGSLEIHLKTAGNRITNPNMMSNQEAFLHELLHSIMGFAIGDKDSPGNAMIQNKLEKFYKQVKRRIDQDGGWRVFAPERPTPEEREFAQERYEYLFGTSMDENGRTRLAERHLHEFAAIGLSDPFMINYLRNLKPDRENNWEDGFLTGLINIVKNAIDWFLGNLDGSNRNMYHAMTKLAGKVSAQNIKYKKVSDQMLDNTIIQRWMNKADDKVAKLFLERKNARIQAWAERQGLTGPELEAKLNEQNNVFGRLFTAASAAAGNAANKDVTFEEFRNALEDAASGIQKDHWLYQLLTEIMPWSSRNHNWIDMMRRSEKLVDMDRQQKIEHSRTAMHNWMGLGTGEIQSRFTNQEREELSHVVLYTDLSSLLDGQNRLTEQSVLNLLRNPSLIEQRLSVLDGDLTTLLEQSHPELLNLFKLHSDGLARIMVHGVSDGVALQTQNVHQMLEQWFYQNPTHRTEFEPDLRERLREILEHRTTLQALKLVPLESRERVYDLMQAQMDRVDTQKNGWVMFLNMHRTYKETALENSFDGNPSSMWKGYVYEVYDDDVTVEVRPDSPENTREMKSQGFRRVSVLPKDEDGPDVTMVLWSAHRGISTYSKAIMSLTDIASRGMSYFDIFFKDKDERDSASWTAAQVHREKNRRALASERQVQRQATTGNKLPAGVRMVPIFHPETGAVVDYRYLMNRTTKRKVLKRRDFYDELMPRMIAAVADRSNTKTVNREAVEMLRDEYAANRFNEAVRFIKIGKGLDGIAGEMWKLLPEDTKQAARELFGSDVMYVRDELVNLVLGFRKLTIANRKFLGPLAPAVRIAERIWQEIIQWERFRIAVLNPAVVLGNIISNIAVLLVHGVNARYIIRHWREAVIGMRKFQRQTRQRNELAHEIDSLRAQGHNVDNQLAELARLDYYLETNSVKPLVDEGLFTNIVEEFGVNEKSYRRKYSNMLLDAAGGLTGSQGLVRAGQEIFMTPGSNTGNIALAATQYGDFVGRYLKFKWDTEVRNIDHKTAVRTALDTFIYYNIPQNKYLQWANDNGFMMFTKFFFRIQPIVARLFSHNPVRALAIFGAQATTDIQVMGDSVSNYAFMRGLPNKLNLNVWDHVTNGEIFYPMSLKWLTFMFDE